MVDIVQSNETKLLIRKIGYSVGLESTLARYKQLIDLYVAEKQLSDPSWRNLVTTGFRRELPARKHFENLFSVLGMFTVDNGRPVPQTILDVGALLKNYYSNDPLAFDRAIRAVLLYSITLADGELFGLLLSTSFDKSKYEEGLAEFRRSKLRIFYESYKNQFDREKLHQIIDFQEVAAGSDGKGHQGALSGPFAQARRVTKSKDIQDFSVSLSADWFKKVPARREAWAQDLGLFDDGTHTEFGRRYLEALRSFLPAEDRSSAIVLMPLDTEMESRHVTWALDGKFVAPQSMLLQAISATYLQAGITSTSTSDSRSLEIEKLARWALDNYQRADTRFQMLRRELPYVMFSLFALGICVASDIQMTDLKSDLEGLAREKRNILLRPSRVSVYGISFSGH
ncbi:hypothetical protein [Lysobacter enzymogenes]|uniref:hypothetical protein n=1 Tax=Lysobacter enzymogenes TaxID=69 RepID=UPI001AF3336E|nr:hypothetical protein [Lysobacter enzymogenes]QQP99554.1 hypothetical protein JHW41_15675 [Lysobacter enzymogenes]